MVVLSDQEHRFHHLGALGWSWHEHHQCHSQRVVGEIHVDQLRIPVFLAELLLLCQPGPPRRRIRQVAGVFRQQVRAMLDLGIEFVELLGNI